MFNLKTYFFLVAALLFAGCASQPIIPQSSDITLLRTVPKGDCKELGLLTGTSLSVKASKEEVLENLKSTAANKGATHVKVEQFSSVGTSVTGMAYTCQ